MEDSMKDIDWAPFQAEFPHLFRDAQLGEMAVGEGWFELLWGLCSSLEIAAAKHEFHIAQVKEKFGGLRLYAHGDIPMDAWNLIQEACAYSETICEACGRPGSHCVIDGWLKTLCSAHQLSMGAEPSHGGPNG